MRASAANAQTRIKQRLFHFREVLKCAHCTRTHFSRPQISPSFPPLVATPRQTPSGTWRIQIEVRGVRDAATLATKRQALDWAARRRAELLAVQDGRVGEVKTLLDACERYGREVSPTKRGEAKEVIRLAAFAKQAAFPGRVRLADLRPEHLAAWRDARLAVNARGSVLRDMTLLGHVLEVALPVSDASEPTHDMSAICI